MSLARNRSCPESRPSSQPGQRAAMESVGHRGSSAGTSGLLVVPGPNYLDFDVDLDDDDEDIVIGIRPKSSPQPRRKTSIEEEDSDISEPPSLSGSRRVSFADAVGLSLVQIKEFDKWDVPQLPDFLDSACKDQEEYFVSPFNFVPSLSSEEIAAKVVDQKIELESVELVPETTILKGVIRVLNISFTKAVYVRISLDNWVSHFDLLSEYIPGSSDGQMDGFSFRLTLMPPFCEQGARVDFCLRYETPCGTFWANNSNRNYVLFCHKRKKEVQEKTQKECAKKSCLKTVSPSLSVDESMSSPERENDAADVTMQQKINERQSKESTNSPAGKSEEVENTPQVENQRNRNRRNRRKAARAARVRDYFAQKDMTTQDSEAQPSPVKQTETAQEQNLVGKHSDCKGNIKLEGNADASLSNDSNSKQHEKLNPTDAAISTDDSKDLPNAAHITRQNINKFVSPSNEESTPESASDCLSGEGVDSERLVSDSGSLGFGTVVAPLYHQVSCRVGGQTHGKTGSSTSTKDQQEQRERSSSGEINDRKGVGLGSTEPCGVMVDIVESPKDAEELENCAEIKTIDLKFVEAKPMECINSNSLNSPENILDLKSEKQGDLSSDDQVTSAHEAAQAQVLDKFSSQIDKNKVEVMLETGELENPADLENESCLCDNVNNPSLDSIVETVPSSLSITIIQKDNKDFQKSQNVKDELNVDGKTAEIASEDFSGKSLLLQTSQHEDLVDHFNITDSVKEPNTDGDKHNIHVSQNHTSKESNDEKTTSIFDDLQKDPFVDPATDHRDVTEEITLDFGDKSMTASSGYASETPEDGNQSSLFDEIWGKDAADESTNSTNLITETNLDSDSSIVLLNHLSSVKENPNLTSQLKQNVAVADQHNMSQGSDTKIRALSTTTASETHEEETLLEQNEDLGKRLHQEQNNPRSEMQEIEEQVENSSLLLAPNNNFQDHAKNSGVCEGDYEAGAAVTSTRQSKLYEESSFLSLQPFQNDKFSSPDEKNIEHEEIVIAAISQNQALTTGEGPSLFKHPSQNDPNNLVLGHSISKTVALSTSRETQAEGNPYLPYQPTSLIDTPMDSKDLVAETMAKSVTCLEATEDKEVVDRETRLFEVVEPNKNITVLSFGERADDGCMETPTDDVKEVGISADLEIREWDQDRLSVEDKGRINDLIMQTENEEIVESQSRLVDAVELQVSDSEVDLGSAEQSLLTEENSLNELETSQDPSVKNEMYVDTSFETEIPSLDSNYEENEEYCTSKSSRTSVFANEKEPNECIASKIEAFLDNLPASESMIVDCEEEERVEIVLRRDEEERSDVSMCKVKCNLYAPVGDVQKSIESSSEKIRKDAPLETEKAVFSQDPNDWSEGASQRNEPKPADNLKLEQTSCNDSNSDSESGSEDEMELYMHCLRAVCGQQSSPKAARTEQNQEKEVKRLSICRGKRLSTSLPSISESLDEEQQFSAEEKEPERLEVKVQPAAPGLPEFSHKEENTKYLWWKETFSCRNFLKTLLYTTLVLIFLAVAYHYDFIACFGLYVMSVIWLFCHGERQTGKNN